MNVWPGTLETGYYPLHVQMKYCQGFVPLAPLSNCAANSNDIIFCHTLVSFDSNEIVDFVKYQYDEAVFDKIRELQNPSNLLKFPVFS